MTAVNVAIISNPNDPHGQQVEAWLTTQGYAVVRFNLSELRRTMLRTDAQGIDLQVNDQWHRVDGTTTVWWHRAGQTSTEGLKGDEAALVTDENMHLLVGMLDACGVRWVDHPDIVARAERKLYQLSIAEDLGIRTPEFHVTNDPEAARQFATGHRIVTKPLSPGVGIAPYTAEVTDTDLDAVRANPVLLQRLVDATADLRVITIDGSAWVWDRPREATTVDWRQIDPHGKAFHSSPDFEVASSAITLMRALGLTMSTQDWLVDSDGHVFLEANPQGAWLFLTGASERIVDALGRHLANQRQSETEGTWPRALSGFLWDLLPAKKAPARDGVVSPIFLDPPWLDVVASWDGALAITQRANDRAVEAVNTAEEKASRLVQLSVVLIAVAIGLAAFQTTAALTGTWPVILRWGVLAPVIVAVGSLSLAALEAGQVDRVGVFANAQLSDLAGRSLRSFNARTIAAEERGRRLARWTSDGKHTNLMQARAWFSRGFAALVVAALIGAVTFASGQPPETDTTDQPPAPTTTTPPITTTPPTTAGPSTTN